MDDDEYLDEPPEFHLQALMRGTERDAEPDSVAHLRQVIESVMAGEVPLQSLHAALAELTNAQRRAMAACREAAAQDKSNGKLFEKNATLYQHCLESLAVMRDAVLADDVDRLHQGLAAFETAVRAVNEFVEAES